MSTVTPNLGLFKYDTTNVTDLASAFNINTALNNNWDIIDNAISNSGGTRNIGEIVASTLPLEDAGLHLLDGALIDGSGIYSEFVQYIVNLYTNNPTANYFTDETTWQDTVTNYGVCGKFVYDSTNNTVRLPKVTGFIEGTTDVNALGALVEAGLPNITASMYDYYNDIAPWVGGSFYRGGDTNRGGRGDMYFGSSVLQFDASRSSSIYGNSSTVQPQTIKVLYYIVIATSAKTDIQVDIDEISTDLNGKCDKDGGNATFSHVTENYVNGASWYRIWSDGWCEQGGKWNVAQTPDGVLITLLKPYRDTIYYPIVCITDWAAAWQAEANARAIVSTNASFIIQSGGNRNPSNMVWQACGYIN